LVILQHNVLPASVGLAVAVIPYNHRIIQPIL